MLDFCEDEQNVLNEIRTNDNVGTLLRVFLPRQYGTCIPGRYYLRYTACS